MPETPVRTATRFRRHPHLRERMRMRVGRDSGRQVFAKVPIGAYSEPWQTPR